MWLYFQSSPLPPVSIDLLYTYTCTYTANLYVLNSGKFCGEKFRGCTCIASARQVHMVTMGFGMQLADYHIASALGG